MKIAIFALPDLRFDDGDDGLTLFFAPPAQISDEGEDGSESLEGVSLPKGESRDVQRQCAGHSLRASHAERRGRLPAGGELASDGQADVPDAEVIPGRRRRGLARGCSLIE